MTAPDSPNLTTARLAQVFLNDQDGVTDIEIAWEDAEDRAAIERSMAAALSALQPGDRVGKDGALVVVDEGTLLRFIADHVKGADISAACERILPLAGRIPSGPLDVRSVAHVPAPPTDDRE